MRNLEPVQIADLQNPNSKAPLQSQYGQAYPPNTIDLQCCAALRPALAQAARGRSALPLPPIDRYAAAPAHPARGSSRFANPPQGCSLKILIQCCTKSSTVDWHHSLLSGPASGRAAAAPSTIMRLRLCHPPAVRRAASSLGMCSGARRLPPRRQPDRPACDAAVGAVQLPQGVQ